MRLATLSLYAFLAVGFAAFAGPVPEDVRKIEIAVWDGAAPGSDAVKAIPGLPFEFVAPRLTVLLPPADRRSGALVLVIPGGGYMYCSADGEGFKIADWLLQRGVGAAVLQYRRNIFLDKGGKKTRVYNDNVALEDAARSMRIIRARAGEWGIDSGRIGALGFSAGGHIAATMATRFSRGDPAAGDALGRFSTRPDFLVLAYPVIRMAPPGTPDPWRDNLLGQVCDPKMAEYYSCQKHVTPETPPCFIVATSDDFTTDDSLAMYEALKAKKVPCEIHLFERGGHGYGMTKPGLAVTACWPALLETWLAGRGVLQGSGVKQGQK